MNSLGYQSIQLTHNSGYYLFVLFHCCFILPISLILFFHLTILAHLFLLFLFILTVLHFLPLEHSIGNSILQTLVHDLDLVLELQFLHGLVSIEFEGNVRVIDLLKFQFVLHLFRKLLIGTEIRPIFESDLLQLFLN